MSNRFEGGEHVIMGPMIAENTSAAIVIDKSGQVHDAEVLHADAHTGSPLIPCKPMSATLDEPVYRVGKPVGTTRVGWTRTFGRGYDRIQWSNRSAKDVVH